MPVRNSCAAWPMATQFRSRTAKHLPARISGRYRGTMGQLLRDINVRQAVYSRLLRHARTCPDTLVVNELGLDHGTNRIDIAIINGSIRGLEIKAEADSLARLPRQVSAYGEVVDKASLIAAPRHLESAIQILPDWWGLVLVRRGVTGAIIFSRLREERVNRGTSPMTLARLLWRPEVVTLLRGFGLSERELRAPREELYKHLVASMPRRDLAAKVRDTLKERVAWRGHPRLS